MVFLRKVAHQTFDSFRRPLYFLGIALIVFGSGLLVYLAVVTALIVFDPESVPLLRMFLSSIEIAEPILQGRLGSQEFTIKAAESLRYLFFGVLGLALVVMLASIANGMIMGGIRLVTITVPDSDTSE